MNLHLTAWNENDTCTWCEKETEVVTASFESGFLKDAPICWKCLQKAVRVHHKQQAQRKSTKGNPAPTS